MKYGTNNLKEIKNRIHSQLSADYGYGEAMEMVNILIEHFFGLSKVEQALNPGYRLSESEMLKLHFAVKDLLRNKPLQYITGEVEFSGLDLIVNESVLIPRPETEELVAEIVSREKGSSPTSVLDIGTGSGCIALALKNVFGEAKVTAVDISDDALEVARKNAAKNMLDVEFLKIDILDSEQWDKTGEYDLIVSNPPYVTQNDRADMRANVLDYEPRQALFVPEGNPLLFYEKICVYAKSRLSGGGRLYFEINEAFGGEIFNLLRLTGFEKVEVFKDFRGKPRFATGTKR